LAAGEEVITAVGKREVEMEWLCLRGRGDVVKKKKVRTKSEVKIDS
jgi:hypothetical protein